MCHFASQRRWINADLLISCIMSCWLGGRKGIQPVKSSVKRARMYVCMYEHCMQPVVSVVVWSVCWSWVLRKRLNRSRCCLQFGIGKGKLLVVSPRLACGWYSQPCSLGGSGDPASSYRSSLATCPMFQCSPVAVHLQPSVLYHIEQVLPTVCIVYNIEALFYHNQNHIISCLI